jgi:hypothetical protein
MSKLQDIWRKRKGRKGRTSGDDRSWIVHVWHVELEPKRSGLQVSTNQVGERDWVEDEPERSREGYRIHSSCWARSHWHCEGLAADIRAWSGSSYVGTARRQVANAQDQLPRRERGLSTKNSRAGEGGGGKGGTRIRT